MIKIVEEDSGYGWGQTEHEFNNEEEESLKKEKIKLEKQQGSLSKLQQKVEIKPYIDEAERDKLEKEIVEIERQAKAERAQADRIAKFIPRDLSAERGWRSLISEKQRYIMFITGIILIFIILIQIMKKSWFL